MNSSPFFIDPIEPSELQVLREIAIRTFDETFASTNTRENMEAYNKRCFNLTILGEEFQNPSSWFYFLRKHSEISGYLKYNIGDAQTELKEDEGFEVERIYILAKIYGSGGGAKLMEYALAKARELSKQYVWLGVHEENFRAINFYKKFGFTEFSDHIFMMGNQAQRDILMKKELF